LLQNENKTTKTIRWMHSIRLRQPSQTSLCVLRPLAPVRRWSCPDTAQKPSARFLTSWQPAPRVAAFAFFISAITGKAGMVTDSRSFAKIEQTAPGHRKNQEVYSAPPCLSIVNFCRPRPWRPAGRVYQQHPMPPASPAWRSGPLRYLQPERFS